VTTSVDTSILAAAIFEEPRSAAARDWFRRMSERIIVSDLTGVEFTAVVSRAVRTRRVECRKRGARVLSARGSLRLR